MQHEIISPVKKKLVIEEIGRLQQTDSLLLSQNHYDVLLADYSDIEHSIIEIGRLREITFREVGEGTGKALDIDDYDKIYKQLILWDKDTQCIVGGYRIGEGDKIISNFGIKGFYTSSLFEMSDDLIPVLQNAAELGRSYIIKEYQQKRLPLFLLWRGILAFLMRTVKYEYLFGPVSISNKYSHLSKSLIIEFIKRHYFDFTIAKYIQPKKKFDAAIFNKDIHTILDSAQNDIKLIDRYIQDFDPEMNGVPVLLKKYFSQNAKIVGFNIDPNFSDALDGLMFLDLKSVPLDKLDGLQ